MPVDGAREGSLVTHVACAHNRWFQECFRNELVDRYRKEAERSLDIVASRDPET